VRSLAPCSIEVQDVTRLSAPNNPSLWSVEEDTQSFSLNGVRATLASVCAVGGVSSKSDTPTTRLDRTFSSSNLWNDPSLPRNGNRTEFVPEVIFDLPPG